MSDKHQGITRDLIKNKSLLLLASLTLLIFVFPYFERTLIGSVLMVLLFTTVLLSGIYAVSYNLRYVAAGLLLAIPTFIIGWSNVFVPRPETSIAEHLSITIFLAYTIIVLLKHIFQNIEVTVDEIFSAVCVYIMIGIAFAHAYAILEEISPEAFYSQTKEISVSTLLYFSFVTLSTVGFGDVTAVSPMAQSLVIIETIIGVIYVAVLIGTLVGAGNFWSKNKEKNEAKNSKETHRSASIFLDRPWILILSAVMLNYATSALMLTINFPFYLDTWATSFSVMISGFYVGATAGIIYNLLMAATYWGASSWVWMFSSILVAAATYYFWRKDWVNIHTPARLLSAGIATGLLNSLLSWTIIYAAKLPEYQGTLPIYDFVYSLTGESLVSSLIEQIIVEVADKTIAITVAAVAVFLIEDLLEKTADGRGENNGNKKE